MKMTNRKKRMIYAALFAVILLAEVMIALYVNDAFIRPYGGDILVTLLLCCFVRIFFPDKLWLLPVWVFLFATVVEISQYFNFVSLIGLGDSAFFRTLLGTSFSFIDLICYGIGCAIFFAFEQLINRLK